MINKFALARSISTPTSNDNILSTDISSTSTQNEKDEHLLARLNQIMPPPPPPSSALIIANDTHFNSTMKTFSLDPILNDKGPSLCPFLVPSIFLLTIDIFLAKSLDELVSSFPIDWSLKSSCRFSSPNSSPFLTSLMKLRSTDEALALDYICSSSFPDNDKAYFRSLTSYWTYPHLPWLRLFPRSQHIQQQLAQNNVNFSALDEQAQIALQDEWKLSFQSLFQAFRAKYCSFFISVHIHSIFYFVKILRHKSLQLLAQQPVV